MCIFIGIESLAANALIELIDKKKVREISFDLLVRYGMEVVKIYQEKTGEEAVLLLSREYQISMIEDYSDYFEIVKNNKSNDLLRLKESVTLDDLNRYFRWTLRLKLIRAFVSPDALRVLGVKVV